MRADRLLVERGLAQTRSQAQRLIAAGVEACVAPRGWQRIGKNGDEIAPEAQLRLLDDAELRYVSRGGLKLEGALVATGLDVHGLNCLDVGQSTGGFTDCLLRRGAARVVGVDVGHGQLHSRLASDPRVVALEGINARSLNAPELIAEQERYTCAPCRFHSPDPAMAAPLAEFDLVTGDLSFISLTLVLPALARLLAARGALLLLAKPQFELQPALIGKGGIVRDERLFAQVEQRLRAACAALGLAHFRWLDSPIAGGDGNREFFILARK